MSRTVRTSNRGKRGLSASAQAKLAGLIETDSFEAYDERLRAPGLEEAQATAQVRTATEAERIATAGVREQTEASRLALEADKAEILAAGPLVAAERAEVEVLHDLTAEAAASIDGRVLDGAPRSSDLVPLAGADGKIAVWLDRGLLGAAGLADPLIASIYAAVEPSIGSPTTSKLGFALKGSELVPLAWASGKVPVWLDQGRLDAAGAGPNIVAAVREAMIPTLGVTTSDTLGFSLRGSRIPLVWAAGKVPAWLDQGKFDAAGIGPNLLALIRADTAGRFASVASVPAGAQPVLATDGRSLRRWRGATAKLRQTPATIVRVGVAGDSWGEYPAIPRALQTLLTEQIGPKSGEGFVGVFAPNVGSLSNNGFSVYDVSGSDAVGLSYGCGPDGHSITATTTTATWSLTNLAATHFRIFYQDLTGTFRVLVDDAVVQTVVGGNTGGMLFVDLPAQVDTTHKLGFDTVGNAGRVAIHGFRADRPGTGGVSFTKIGNANTRGAHYSLIKNQVAAYSTHLALDVLVIFLGTNDYRLSDGTTRYVQGLTDLITAHRSANPALGVIIVHPAACGVTVSPAQGVYRDASLALAQASGFEHLSLFDSFDTYAIENAAGQWVDLYHLTNAGAWRPALEIMKLLGA